MPAIILNETRINNADTFSQRLASHPSYIFIGRDQPWPNENLPPELTGSDNDRIQAFYDILALKKIEASFIKSVCPRIDWNANIVYDQFDHRINMIDSKSPNTGDFLKFYVLTDEFNVYKCLSNNYGAASTVKPTSQQITPFETSDGYIWKYMYTVRSQDVFNFLTASWMPCYTLFQDDGSSQWLVQQTAVDGAIHTIVVDNPGAGYSPVSPPVVVITGDGTAATATVDINPSTGAIERINVVTPGAGYTNATITFTNVGGGVGASATAILSPIGGHGKNARVELGATRTMVKTTLNGDESGFFPTGDFRRAGIITNPFSTALGSILVVQDSKYLSVGDTVTGQTSGAFGIIREIDFTGKYVYVENVVGSFLQNETIQNVSGEEASIVSAENTAYIPLTQPLASKDDIIPRTGEIIYIANREKVTRTSNQSEDIRFVFSF